MKKSKSHKLEFVTKRLVKCFESSPEKIRTLSNILVLGCWWRVVTGCLVVVVVVVAVTVAVASGG